MAYKVIILYRLYMPSYFLGTFTEYPYIQPGKKQVLTVRVDNRKRYDMSVNDLAHAYTDATQVKWNGILGDMYIKAVEKTRVESLQLYPDAASRTVKAVVSVYNSSSQTAQMLH